MSTASEKYAELLRKFDRINEVMDEPEPGWNSATAPDTGGAGIDKYKPNDKIPEIKASNLSQAKEIALKQLGPGKKFRWCSTYKVDTTKKKPQPPKQDGLPAMPWDQALPGGIVKK